MKRTSERSAFNTEKDSLKRMLIDAVSVLPARKKQKSKNGTLTEMNLRHGGIASVTVKSLNPYCAQESCEISHLQPPSDRRWEFRAVIVEYGGVLVVFNAKVAPYPGDSITSQNSYFVPSF